MAGYDIVDEPDVGRRRSCSRRRRTAALCTQWRKPIPPCPTRGAAFFVPIRVIRMAASVAWPRRVEEGIGFSSPMYTTALWLFHGCDTATRFVNSNGSWMPRGSRRKSRGIRSMRYLRRIAATMTVAVPIGCAAPRLPGSREEER